jgi:ABC-2 type transport system ATP-binding protein
MRSLYSERSPSDRAPRQFLSWRYAGQAGRLSYRIGTVEPCFLNMATDWALELENVKKVYGHGKRRVEALRGVSLRVRRGEIFGLLGPNGAGKTTLVKIMMTVVRPTRAAGTILGHAVGAKPVLARMGYLPEHHRFPRYLTGRQTLEFFGAMTGVDQATRRRRAGELLELVSMQEWGHRRVETYSKGMMQRVGLAQALMNDPELVVLDEPTDGVDPIGRKDILTVLKRLRAEGRTVFVNSHLLSELELISDRVAIMVRGQVVRQGTMADLTAHRVWFELEVTPETAGPVAGIMQVTPSETPPVLKGRLDEGTWVEVEARPGSTLVRVGTADAERVQATLDRLRQKGCVIRRMEMVRPSLEELFIEAVADQAPGQRKGAGSGPVKIPPLPEVRP